MVDDFCTIGELETLAVVVVVVGRIGSLVEIFVPLFATVAFIVSGAFFLVLVLMDVAVVVFTIGTIGTTLDFVVVDVEVVEIFFVDVNDGFSITEGDFLEPVVEECDPVIIFDDDDSAPTSFPF